jgi:hypothetical protein
MSMNESELPAAPLDVAEEGDVARKIFGYSVVTTDDSAGNHEQSPRAGGGGATSEWRC